MAVTQTNSVQLRGVDPLVHEGSEKKPTTPTLQDVFAQDNIKQSTKVGAALILEGKVPTFWERISSWFSITDADTQNSTASDADTAKKLTPIELLPVLETPDFLPPELDAAILAPSQTKGTRKTMTPKELAEGISLMSERTIEEVMCIVMKGQIELEKENANVAQSTFTKYQNIRKLQERILEEIKDALTKDEKVLSWAKTGQNVALFASFVCGLATAAVSFGLLAPVGAGIGLTAITALATYGPVVSAGLTGVATASKAYSQRRLDEDQAKHEQYNHQDKSLSDRIEEASERLMSTVEADEVFKESMVKLVKRMSRMSQLAMQK